MHMTSFEPIESINDILESVACISICVMKTRDMMQGPKFIELRSLCQTINVALFN